MKRKEPISSFGWEIKKRLAEMQMDQKAFCKSSAIPEHCLSRLITGKGKKYRKEVIALLNIEDPSKKRV